MRRERFYLSPRQRIGVPILAAMVAMTLVFIHLVPQSPPEPTDNGEGSAPELNKVQPRTKERVVVLREFDPNTADSSTLVEVGLRPWQAHNILKYRQRGGRYRRDSDLKRLYGMTDSLYATLQPYIRIDSSQWLTIVRDTIRIKDTVRYAGHAKRDTLICLNSADTADLQYIRGIGRHTACAIVHYRQQLGGYVSPEQVREIEAISKNKIPVDSILPHLMACPDSVTRISVNHASIEHLVRHPYISYTQAEQIYHLRRQRIRLNSMTDLQELSSIQESDIERLTPYLSFE